MSVSLFFNIAFTTMYLFVSMMTWSCKAQKPIQKDSAALTIIDTTKPVADTVRLDTFVNISYIMGKFDPASHALFAEIPAKYVDRSGLYLRKDVLAAFVEMYEAAKKDGVHLIIKSATRNFANQKTIWENKWNGNTILEGNINAATDIKDPAKRAIKILEYSSMPGSSRHHWGTDLDINDFTNEWFSQGEGLKIYAWMTTHAGSFGFCQPYSKIGSDRNNGYYEEKWHWTYMPVSMILTTFATQNLKNEMISGFKGAETAIEIDIVNNFVLGISPSCK